MFRLIVAVAFCGALQTSVAEVADGLIRRWEFEEGRWNLVKNSAPVFPGRIGPHGGTLGSLVIPSITVYGMDYDAYEPRQPKAIQPTWTTGRRAGLNALCIGTRSTGPFGSGLSGEEFAKGFTFAGWVRPHSSSDGLYSVTLLRMGDAWNCGFAVRAEAAKWCPEGRLSVRFAMQKGKDGKNRYVDVSAPGFKAGAWHFFAIAWDGKTVRMEIDGRVAATSGDLTEIFAPIAFARTWTGCQPFFEETVHGRFIVGGGNGTAVVDVDEIMIYDRALSSDELLSAMGPAAEGTVDEQCAEARRQDEARTRAERITLEIPRSTGGYFRIGEDITATASVPQDVGIDGTFTAAFRLTTLDGKEIASRSRSFAAGEAVRETFRPPQCGVYYLDMEIRGADGRSVKRYDEPWCIGVVPPKPKTLDSPFGYWATEDAFSHDANLRRLACYFGDSVEATEKGWKESAYTVRQHRLFTEKQGLGDSVRCFSWLTIENTKEKTLAPERLARLRDGVWPLEIALMKRLGVKEFEFSSEQNHNITPEAYVQQLKVLVPMVRKEIPDAVLYPAGATPVGVDWTERVLALGGKDLVDGVSIHPYTADPIKDYHKGGVATKFHDAVKRVAPNLPLYSTENGVSSLPRVYGRPMTREEADRAPYPAFAGSPRYYQTSMPVYTEAETAAMSCQAALMTLATGFRTYVQCQNSMWGALPCLVSVARTALSGQVLNGMCATPRVLPLPSFRSAAVLVERRDGSTVLAVFGTADEPVSFLFSPNAAFKTMDVYGNYGEIRAGSDGFMTLTAKLAPTYVFGVPRDVSPVTPLRIDIPDTLPSDGMLAGTLCVTNPFPTTLTGTLKVQDIRGATVTLGESEISLATGRSANVAVRIDGRGLKRGDCTFRVDLVRDGGAALSAERIFRSAGVMQLLPKFPPNTPLDGDEAKWSGVPSLVSDSENDVSLGKPDKARPWAPQWTGADDLAVNVQAAWTEDGSVRFLLNVTDDILMPAPKEKSGEAFRWDCLELFVDTRIRHMFGSFKKTPGADQVLVVPEVGDASSQCAVYYPGGDARHIDVTCVGRRTRSGYLIEGCIVPRKGCELPIRAGERVAMDFLVDDRDALDVPRKSAIAIHGHAGNNNDIPAWGRYRFENISAPGRQ